MSQLRDFIFLHNTFLKTDNKSLAKAIGVDLVALWSELELNFNDHVEAMSLYFKCRPDLLIKLNENRHWSGSILQWLKSKVDNYYY